jgi:hypothetical protein
MTGQPPTIKTPFLDVSTEDGDLRIYEDDLSRITAAELKQLRMTREVLQECFAEGVRLMKDRDWAKQGPCADETLEGEWFVLVVGYNQHTHPLMEGPASGNA